MSLTTTKNATDWGAGGVETDIEAKESESLAGAKSASAQSTSPTPSTIAAEPELENDPAKLMDYLRQWQQLFLQIRAAKTKEEKAILWTKANKIRAHCFALQQPPAAPAINLNEQNAARGKAISVREGMRDARIREIARDLADTSTWPVEPASSLAPVLRDFIATPNAVALIDQTRKALAFHEGLCAMNFRWLFPAARQEEINSTLAAETYCPDETALYLIREREILDSKLFQSIASKRRATLAEIWRADVLPPLVELLQSAVAFVTERKASILADEKKFFAAQGMVKFTSQAGKQFDSILQNLDGAIARLTRRPLVDGRVPEAWMTHDSNSPLAQLFGIQTFRVPVDASADKQANT